MRFANRLNFHKMIRRVPIFLRVLIVAVIAAIFSTYGGHGSQALAMAGIITMPLNRKIVSKGRRKKKAAPPSANPKMTDLDITFISLTDELAPVNGLPVVMKARRPNEKDQFEIPISIVSKAEKEGILYGIVYSPDEVDAQKDWTDAKEIQKAAHRFLAKARTGNVDVDHNQVPGAGTIVESSILSGPSDNYPLAKAGSWGVAIQLSEQMKKAQIGGISMYGGCNYAKATDPNADPGANPPGDADPDGDGKSLQALRAAAGVGDVQMAAALGLDHQDYLDFENGDADIDWTSDQIKAAAKILKMPTEEFAAQLLNGDDPSETTDPTAGPNPNQDPAEPAPIGTTGKGAPKTLPIRKTTMPIPESRRVLKATEPKTIKVNGAGETIIGFSEIRKGMPFRHQIIGKAVLYAMKASILKEGVLPESYFETPEQLISKGLFTPGDFDPSGTIQPALAREVFDVTVDRSGFLKKIQTVMMSSIEQNVAVADIGERTMTRLTVAGSPGMVVAPGSQAKTVNLAKQLHAYELDLPFFVPFSLIYNYQGNLPALEQKIGEIVMLSNANQFVDLGWNGTTDTFDGSTFTTLGKGWRQTALDAIAASTDGANPLQSFSIAGIGGLTTPLLVMDYMIGLMSQYQARYANINNAFVISSADFEAFEKARIARPNSEQVLIDGAQYKYRGHEMHVVDYLATGQYMYTPFVNYLFGMVTQGQGGTRLQSLEVLKGIQHNLESAVDYDFVNYQPIIVASA